MGGSRVLVGFLPPGGCYLTDLGIVCQRPVLARLGLVERQAKHVSLFNVLRDQDIVQDVAGSDGGSVAMDEKLLAVQHHDINLPADKIFTTIVSRQVQHVR